MVDLQQLETHAGYSRLFTDVNLWQPAVEWVCQQHALAPCQNVRSGLPGTFPTFIVEDRWVVKFFGRLFDGAEACAVERSISEWLHSTPSIPAPALLGEGVLHLQGVSGWRYLIYEYVPGVSIGEVYDQVTFEDKLALAQWMGKITRDLHAAPLENLVGFQPTWVTYLDMLRTQKLRLQQSHREWGTPEAWITQMDAYLLPVEDLIEPGRAPHLIHADLTADHLLGEVDGNGRWQTHALIDFGDGMVGSLYYELAALHLSMFQCDKRLLKAYLETYGVDDSFYITLPTRAMSTFLLHRCNVLSELWHTHPQTRQIGDLQELASSLWDINGISVQQL